MEKSNGGTPAATGDSGNKNISRRHALKKIVNYGVPAVAIGAVAYDLLTRPGSAVTTLTKTLTETTTSKAETTTSKAEKTVRLCSLDELWKMNYDLFQVSSSLNIYFEECNRFKQRMIDLENGKVCNLLINEDPKKAYETILKWNSILPNAIELTDQIAARAKLLKETTGKYLEVYKGVLANPDAASSWEKCNIGVVDGENVDWNKGRNWHIGGLLNESRFAICEGDGLKAQKFLVGSYLAVDSYERFARRMRSFWLDPLHKVTTEILKNVSQYTTGSPWGMRWDYFDAFWHLNFHNAESMKKIFGYYNTTGEITALASELNSGSRVEIPVGSISIEDELFPSIRANIQGIKERIKDDKVKGSVENILSGPVDDESLFRAFRAFDSYQTDDLRKKAAARIGSIGDVWGFNSVEELTEPLSIPLATYHLCYQEDTLLSRLCGSKYTVPDTVDSLYHTYFEPDNLVRESDFELLKKAKEESKGDAQKIVDAILQVTGEIPGRVDELGKKYSVSHKIEPETMAEIEKSPVYSAHAFLIMAGGAGKRLGIPMADHKYISDYYKALVNTKLVVYFDGKPISAVDPTDAGGQVPFSQHYQWWWIENKVPWHIVKTNTGGYQIIADHKKIFGELPYQP